MRSDTHRRYAKKLETEFTVVNRQAARFDDIVDVGVAVVSMIINIALVTLRVSVSGSDGAGKDGGRIQNQMS
mgnify:CR=1 FL=1